MSESSQPESRYKRKRARTLDFHRGTFEVRVKFKNGTPLCLARDNLLARAETKARWILMEHILIVHGHREPWRIPVEYALEYVETTSEEQSKFRPSDCFYGADYQAEVLIK